MLRYLQISAVLLFLSGIPAIAGYQGSLSTPGGVVAGGSWANDFAISWDVTVFATYVHYEYTLEVSPAAGAFSHFILETSQNFGARDIFNLAVSPVPLSPVGMEIKQHVGPSPGNPNMPGNLYGIKFEPLPETRLLTIAFDSTRLPVWGDFYAKDGTGPTYAYNEGFSRNDPTDPPANGSLDNHILVPDTVVVVPAPAAAGLGLLGLVTLGSARRRLS